MILRSFHLLPMMILVGPVRHILFLSSVLAFVAPVVIFADDGCEFSKNFSDADSTHFDILVPGFRVQAGAATVCQTSCVSGKRSSLYLLYGDTATSDIFDGSDSDSNGCDMETSIKSSKNETALGIFGKIRDPFVNFTISCSCTKAYEPPSSGGDLCFSASDTVQVLDQHDPVAMKDLKVGDYVKTGKSDAYQKVYGFGHRHETKRGEFVQLFYTLNTASNENSPLLRPRPPLELSPKHLVFVRTATAEEGKTSESRYHPVRADAVKLLDEIVHQETKQSLVITRIERVYKSGLYMPLTPDGTIVINNDILVSAYVSIADHAPAVVRTGRFFGFSEHQLFHWLMTPLRMVCMGISSKLCTADNTGTTVKSRIQNINSSTGNEHESEDEGILRYLVHGRTIVTTVNDWDYVSFHLLGAGVALVLGFLVLVESVWGSALAPVFIMLALLAVLVMWYRLCYKFRAKSVL